jgi:regulator of protease activity HflC (stomatin/prohibitin superfamily)
VSDEAGRKRRHRWAVVAAGASVLVALTLVLLQSGLQSRLVEVDEARARVVQAVKHQRATRQVWEPRPDSRDRQAELDGAANRIRVEAGRYDEAVSRYNRASSAFPNGLARFFSTLPERRPFSSEIDTW